MTDEPERFLDDAALGALFAEARLATALPPPDLMGRIMADAQRHMPAAAGLPAAPPRTPWRRLASRAVWPTGLSAAGLAGLWIGLAAGGNAASLTLGLLDSSVGLQFIYQFPAMAGLFPGG